MSRLSETLQRFDETSGEKLDNEWYAELCDKAKALRAFADGLADDLNAREDKGEQIPERELDGWWEAEQAAITAEYQADPDVFIQALRDEIIDDHVERMAS